MRRPFVEIDHEIFSTVILPLPLIQDDDEFRFNDASTHEGHLLQNVELTWFCNETIILTSHPLIQEGQLSVSDERMCTLLVNRLED